MSRSCKEGGLAERSQGANKAHREIIVGQRGDFHSCRGNPRALNYGFERVAEKLGESIVACAIVSALIFLARPSRPMIQMP